MENTMEFSYSKDWKEITISLDKVIGQKDTWLKNGVKIISYGWVKKIADYCNIVIKETPQLLCTPKEWNHQQHIWWMWLGFSWDKHRDIWEYSEWEANRLNTWEVKKGKDGKQVYRERTIDWAYKSAMAYKRAYVRWVIKMIKLFWVYGDVESNDFINEGSLNYDIL